MVRVRARAARSDRDGAARKPFSNRTVAVRRCERLVQCVSYVYLCPVPGPRTLIFRLPGADKHVLLHRRIATGKETEEVADCAAVSD